MLHGIFHKEDKVLFRLWSDIFPPTHAFQEYELHLSTMDDMLMYEQFIIIIIKIKIIIIIIKIIMIIIIIVKQIIKTFITESACYMYIYLP